MTVHFVTATLGGGKSLICANRAREYLNSGRPVATNMDLYFDKYPDSYTTDKPYCIRLPDHPTSQNIKDLGFANETPDESKNGLLLLDEVGTWFNSHGWNHPDRKEFVDVLLHIRKLGWDCLFMVQDFEMVDKQARNSIGEFVVYCKRMDRLNIPFLSFITKLLTDKAFPMPRVHIGRVMYGQGSSAIRADTWIYRGTELFDFYNTKQIFDPNYEHGSYCYLKPSNYHYDKETILRAKKDYSRRSLKRLWHLRPPVLFFFILGLIAAFMFQALFFGVEKATAEEGGIDIPIQSDTAPSEPQNAETPAKVITSDIRLKGVFTVGSRTEYFFYLDGDRYEPAQDGFAYIPHTDCGAILIKDDFKQTVTCTYDEDFN